jgi:hypothetical protein
MSTPILGPNKTIQYWFSLPIKNKKQFVQYWKRNAGHFESVRPTSENWRWNQFDSLVQEQNFLFPFFPPFSIKLQSWMLKKEAKTWITSPTHALHKIGEWDILWDAPLCSRVGGVRSPPLHVCIRRIMRSFFRTYITLTAARCANNSLEKPRYYSINQYSIRSRRISDRKVGLELNVLWARLFMSSREQSCEIRTSSQRAPPLIMSFAFTSALQKPRILKEQVVQEICYSIRWEKSMYHAVPSGRVQAQYDAWLVELHY